MTTILTEDRAEKDIAHDKAESLDWRRFQILLSICYEHYIHVDTKPDLATLCRTIVNIGNDFTGETFDDIPIKGRDRLVGKTIREAVDHDYGKKRTGNISMKTNNVFESLANDLIKLVHDKEGCPIDKSKDGAPEVVAKLFFKYGITNNGKKYSASAIYNF